jgi:hypothetical protein
MAARQGMNDEGTARAKELGIGIWDFEFGI